MDNRKEWDASRRLLHACIYATLMLAGCTLAKQTSSTGQSHVGWYLQHAGQGRFQACGNSQSLQVTANAALSAKAKAFGLQDDTPVYVRLSGSVRGNELRVAGVDQFGSPAPVRNCGLTGVVIPDPSSPTK